MDIGISVVGVQQALNDMERVVKTQIKIVNPIKMSEIFGKDKKWQQNKENGQIFLM